MWKDYLFMQRKKSILFVLDYEMCQKLEGGIYEAS